MCPCVSGGTRTHKVIVDYWPASGMVVTSLEGAGKSFWLILKSLTYPEVDPLGERLQFTALSKTPFKNQIDDSKEVSKIGSPQVTIDKLCFFRDKGLRHTADILYCLHNDLAFPIFRLMRVFFKPSCSEDSLNLHVFSFCIPEKTRPSTRPKRGSFTS